MYYTSEYVIRAEGHGGDRPHMRLNSYVTTEYSEVFNSSLQVQCLFTRSSIMNFEFGF